MYTCYHEHGLNITNKEIDRFMLILLLSRNLKYFEKRIQLLYISHAYGMANKTPKKTLLHEWLNLI